MNSTKTLLVILVINLLVAVASIVINFQFFSGMNSAASAPEAAESSKKSSSSSASSVDPKEYLFFTVEKLIVSVRDEEVERYFVIDLVLQAENKTDKKKLEKIEPAVRSAVVAYLSDRNYEDIRSRTFAQTQKDIEKAVFAEFKTKNVVAPFTHVLVSKLIAQ